MKILNRNSNKLPKGIRLHKSGKYIVDICINGRRKTQTFDTLPDAILGRAELSLSLEGKKCESKINSHQKRIVRSDTWTLEEAVEKTRQHIWSGTGGERVAMINARIAQDFFGAKTPVNAITLDHIDDYVSYLEDQGNSGSTINRKLSALSRILRTAHERGKLSQLPKMPRRKEGEHRVRFLTPDEERALVIIAEKMGYEDHKDAILLLLYTGFRCGELWRLECRDIDLTHATITAWKTKNGHPRTIPIVDTIRHIIERRMTAVDGIGKIFPGATNDWLRVAWERIRLHMGMDDDPQFVPHMLRHTCATRLAQAGVSMKVIMQWMGHRTMQTTARYTHFSPTDLYNAAQLLEKTARGCSKVA